MADVLSSVQAMFVERYADEVAKLVPESNIIGEDAPFLERKMEGRSYIQPVVVSNEQGFTYSKANGGAATLADSYGANVQRATITGQNVILRTIIAREDIDRGDSDMKSVEDVMDLITTNTMSSVHNRLEIGRIYGGLSLAQISAIENVTTASADMDLTILGSSWSDGIWSASQGALLKIRSSDTNIGAYLGGGTFRVNSIDVDTKKINIVPVTGTLIALETALNATGVTGYVFFAESVDAANQVEQYGFKKILTTSGSIFGIDNSVYSLWKGNTMDLTSYVTAGTGLSLKYILLGTAKAVGRGFMGPMNVYVNPKTFATLANDQASLRKYDASYSSKEANNGSEKIMFHGSNGSITIKTHFFMKEGDAFGIPSKEVFRVGASNVKFEPLAGEGNYLKGLEAKDGYELRVTTNQAIFIRKPSWAVYFKGIVNA